MVDVDQSREKAVVQPEGRAGGEAAWEPLEQDETDVLHDDEDAPEAANLECLWECEKISPVLSTVAADKFIHGKKREIWTLPLI